MSMLKNKQALNFIKNMFSLGMLQIINYILPILTIPFLVSTIGIGNVGVIAIATAFCTYFQICIDYGFNLTATREIASIHNDTNSASAITSAVFNIKIILSIPLFFIFFAIVYLVPAYSSEIRVFVITYFICVCQSMFPQWHFQATERMIYITIANSIPKILATILLFFIIHSPTDTWKVQTIYFFGTATSAIWAFIILKVKFKFNYRFDLVMIKKQVAHGWNIFTARFFSTLYKNSNVLIIGALCPPALVGGYAVAEKIIRAAQTVQNVVGDSLFPWVVKQSGGDGKFFKIMNDRYKKIIITIYMFSAIFVFFFADFIAKILVRHEWQIVGSQLKIMAFVFFFGGLNYFYGILGLVAHGFNKFFSRGVIAAGLFNVITCYLLVLKLSITGASITMVLSEALLLILIIVFIKKSGITK
ncbi:oligosaccharide flippase family protein [Acerihabitans sp. TG2]|uniref:oligosaccharide flippase family protein n=1 Tax=Acerihabitans sp. TG2 TaxID=3096008 RepID=UPI002B237BD8|nr:oligosaccharide flippase family protein [Acerihabitans sp. TG2]MEA9389298.1 oligosaccharide flippase family protein [Acerihabitans sp. TG2]